ncbi:hypothetical protein Pfo_023485 [Paulownia fortunei]|nr:hypothetical protein Pfo_023485 [Paulownia fortunei]
MGYDTKKISSACIFLFFLIPLIISFACPTPSLDKLQASASVSKTEFQVFQIKKTDLPIFLNSNEKGRRNKNEKGLYRNTMKRKRTKNLNTRPFTAMLPKGYVPPSGSSPCHNVYPNSVTFFCGLSAERYPVP